MAINPQSFDKLLEFNIKKKIGGLELQLTASIPSNGITAVFGTSGTGKTSLLNMIAGVLKPDDGEIKLDETVLFKNSANINLRPEERKVGYVFQDTLLFPHLSVLSNLKYGMKVKKRNITDKIRHKVAFDEVVNFLGIETILKRKPEYLSGGEKQRVAIGRALLSSPDLLLMDEPLNSLDEERKIEVIKNIKKINNNFQIPIVFVSHIKEEVETLSNVFFRLTNNALEKIKNAGYETS